MILQGRSCELYREGSGGPVFFLCTGHHEEGPDELLGFIRELSEKERSFSVFVLRAGDWDKDYAPWEAEAPGGRVFSGGAEEVITFLTDTAVPYVKEHSENNGHFYIAGYSLAALFALYTLYKTDVFSGCACVSGSLWFPGFMDYTKEHRLPGRPYVYLSLGGKEPNSKDPLMKTVGDCYKAMERQLKKELPAGHVVYEMNPGGHFGNSQKRLAKGFSWLLDHDDKEIL